MAYTPEQLAEVRQAIVDLGLGKRVVSVTQNGRTVQFAQTDIDKLKALAREIAEALPNSTLRRRTRTRSVMTSKGL
ncbi:gpW family head-tail joining protein [Vreelandella sp.]|uniref:gpW family head-tail joining protein n=1 Tax=Vreelandella sp. TaxID=3137778 RepID=UPI003BAD0E2E